MTKIISTWKNLRRTPYQSLTALLTVITTFFMVFVFSTFLYLAEEVLEYFETQPQILVFFKTDVSDSEATATASLIGQLTYVDEIKIVGKTQAFENYKLENADEPLLLELLTPDLFPASLSITATTPEGLMAIRQELEKIDTIDEIDYREDVINEFLSWTKIIRNIGWVACGLFTLQFILVIMIITSMKVIGRRRSINIMSVLGAGNDTIKSQFVIESMWLGAIGSIIAFIFTQLLVMYLTPTINNFLGEIKVLPFTWEFLSIQLVGGVALAMLLAAFSAWLATTRLIKK